LRVGQQLPLLEEHARLVSGSEGKGKSLGLSRLEDSMWLIGVLSN